MRFFLEQFTPLLRLLFLVIEQLFEADGWRVGQSLSSQAALGDVAAILHTVKVNLADRFIRAINGGAQVCGARRHPENPSTIGDEFVSRMAGARVENFHAGNLVGLL